MSKPKPKDRERNAHPIRWGDADWEQINAVADHLTEQDGIEWTPTAVIRRATRIFVQSQLQRKP